MSATEVLVLGLIRSGAKYGHEIDKRLDEWQIRLWNRTNRATIYKVLQRMEKKNWISSDLEKIGNYPERKVYSLTSEGERALQKMVAEGLASKEIVQFEQSVWIGFMEVLPPSLVAQQIKRRRSYVRNLLEQFPLEEDLEPNCYLGKKANIKFLRSYYQLELEWLDWILEEMRKDETE